MFSEILEKVYTVGFIIFHVFSINLRQFKALKLQRSYSFCPYSTIIQVGTPVDQVLNCHYVASLVGFPANANVVVLKLA